jgi:hypothetical protein
MPNGPSSFDSYRQIQFLRREKLHEKGFILLALVLLLSVTPALSQDNPTIKGSVIDPNGAIIAGATVTATHALTRQTREAITDARGQYTLSNLAPGKYTVVASARDLQPVSKEVELGSGESATADLQLPLQKLEQEIEVSAAARYDRSALPTCRSAQRSFRARKSSTRRVARLMTTCAISPVSMSSAIVLT